MFKKSNYLQSMLFGMFIIVLLFMTVSNTAAEKWQAISELPTHREDFSTAVVGDKIYLIGGTLFENRLGPFGLSTVEAYDPKTNTWRRVADMPTSRAAPATAVVDNKIYVIGGHSGIDRRIVNIKTSVAVEVYNPQTDTWERKQEMPVPRRQFGVGVVAGKIYAIGGYVLPQDRKPEEPGRVDLVKVYDPATNTWARRAKMPTKRDGFGVGVVNNHIYAIGGRGWPQVGPGGPFLKVIEEYDPKINRWRQKHEIPDLRLSFSTVVLDDVIYLIGGFIWQDRIPQYLSTVDTYNPATEEWRDIPPMPTPFIPFGAAVANGNIYVFGGRGENREHFTNVFVFDTGFRAVTAVGKLSTRWGELKTEYQNQPEKD
jgi:N-acetylneuraminic acid mutarotase